MAEPQKENQTLFLIQSPGREDISQERGLDCRENLGKIRKMISLGRYEGEYRIHIVYET